MLLVRSKPEKVRLDTLLAERGLYQSREKAQRAIMAGEVRAGDRHLDKPGMQVPRDIEIDVAPPARFVSRGGLKLEGALGHFQISVAETVCLDIGASTGGFTDCLLQYGASKVYAFDVGHSQLDWKLRTHPRVIAREKINARFLTEADLPEKVHICVIDVSFISLNLILPAAFDLLRPDGVILALIKPQFELNRGEVGKGGVVRESVLHEKAVQKIKSFAIGTLQKSWLGFVESPILGTTGNKEFFACLRH